MSPGPRRDRELTAALERWFARSARDLPWRPERGRARDPYHALVSEFMLQQTQVGRVVDYFRRFIARWPDLAALARADEREVLQAWAGLGYYRRARHLLASARTLASRPGGDWPREPSGWAGLPGVGRYTAGAISSIVFGTRTPAVDGNVRRVLLRLEGRDLDPASPRTADWTWHRAGELVGAAPDPGVWTEGLMELGATLCLPPPAAPRCDDCPLARACRAHAEGTTSLIPRPTPRRRPRERWIHAIVVSRSRRGVPELLLTRRARGGLWGGLLAPPEVEAQTRLTARQVARRSGASEVREIGLITRVTSAAIVRFVVFTAARAAGSHSARWIAITDLGTCGLSSAHRAVVRLALSNAMPAGSTPTPPARAAATRARPGTSRRR